MSLFERRQDIAGVGEKSGVGILDPGALFPGQGMPAQEQRRPAESFARAFANEAFGAAHVRHQRVRRGDVLQARDTIQDGAHRREPG